MGLDSLLASLKSGVTEVTEVQASRDRAFACNPARFTEVAEVSDVTVEIKTATLETPHDTTEVTAQPASTEACTHETPVTPETIKCKDSVTEGNPCGTGDTATVSRWWLIHYPDRDPVEVTCCPEATHADILERHPDAIAAEPFTPIDLEAWEERAAICEFDGGLSRDEAEQLAWQEDDRRRCSQCGNLSLTGVCRIAEPKAGALVVANRGYRPVQDILGRCRGFVPGRSIWRTLK